MRLIQIALISAAFSVGSAATGSSSDSKTKFESKWTPEDYLVKGLDKYGSTDTMYSGYMPVDMKNNSRGSLFFWLVMKRNSEKTVSKGDKIVIWLNGGPGCSSLIGMMWENGPFHIVHALNGTGGKNFHLQNNPYSWNEEAHVLYLEQPIGTGFSRPANDAEPMRNEFMVSRDMFGFLQSFLSTFEDMQHLPLFISGESYAGAYIPWMADYIINMQIDNNQAKGGGDTAMKAMNGHHFINLLGVAIGNGVIDDYIQASSYSQYAYFHGLIPLAAQQRIDREYTRCLMAAEGGDMQARREMYFRQPYSKSFQTKQSNGRLIANTFDSCRIMEMVLSAAGNPNQYNTATFNGYDFIGAPGGPFQNFFADAEIQTILHVRGWDIPGINFIPRIGDNGDTSQMWLTNDFIDELSVGTDLDFYVAGYTPQALQKLAVGDIRTSGLPDQPPSARFYFSPNVWSVCSDAVSASMEDDSPVTTVPALQFIMRFIRVLLYSGEFDLNCNTLGTLHTLENAMWAGRMWNTAKRSLWQYMNDVQGEYFELEKLAFLIVRNSGHLLPMDLPGAALNLITRFTTDTSFADIVLPTEDVYNNDAIPIAVANDDQHEELATYESSPIKVLHRERVYGGGRAPDDGRGFKLFTVVSLLLGGFFAAVFVALPWVRARVSMPVPYAPIPSEPDHA